MFTAIQISSIINSRFAFFDLHIHDVYDLHQLLAQQFALPVIAPQGNGRLAQFLVLVRRHVQTINVVSPRTERSHNLKKSSVPVFYQQAEPSHGTVW
jgi:hypothetical protein